MTPMQRIREYALRPEEAALWFLGQAGYVARAGEVSLVIDPYLSDAVGRVAPLFSRAFPPPINPGALQVDLFLVTHDHLDHLDPETVGPYAHKATTTFVAPRFAARHLRELGVPEANLTVVDVGDTAVARGVAITGVFALPTGTDALDTTGYLVAFPNGRSFYHASDTAFCPLLLQAAPRAEVLLTPINGKFGNLNVEQAAELARAVQPRFVLPNHYDVMARNAENPETFTYICGARGVTAACVIPRLLEPFTWDAVGGRNVQH